VDRRTRWVLLAYRLPREPSTPRITLWRHLRRLDARTREQLEWLAEEVVENHGEATIWLAEPGSTAHERSLARQMVDAVRAEYDAVIAEADAALETAAARRRTLARLRRELRRIASRDYFPTDRAKRARAAVEALGAAIEVAS